MRHLTFGGQDKFKFCFLVPVLNHDSIVKEYITPFGLDPSQVVAFDLELTGKKTPVTIMKAYLEELAPILKDLGCEYVMIADSGYFKVMAKASTAEARLGYVDKGVYEDLLVTYIPNFKQVFYDPPKVRAKISQGILAVKDHASNCYKEPGHGIIKTAHYPRSYVEIKAALQMLYDMNVPLTCDIEAFSLKHYDAGIGTIAFAWNQNEGVAFPVDLGLEGKAVRELLKAFFKENQNRLIWHNISYDVYVLIYQLFMEHLEDTEGLLQGQDIMLKNWDDTKLITYLATNSCAGNKLSLKDIAQEFAGNYAQDDIKDITKIPLDELLEYNLVDCLSTWYAHNKHYQTMVDDNQLQIYEEIFKPAIWDIIQMQLTGMPVDPVKVEEAATILEAYRDDAIKKLWTSHYMEDYEHIRKEKWVCKRNAELKKKRVGIEDFPDKERFNINSGDQLQGLLYQFLELPVLDLTDSKQPSTQKETLEKLKNHTKDPAVLTILEAAIAFSEVNILITTFIKALRTAKQGPSGQYYLFGNFNLGGTVSGRLSSSKPNLQNIPAQGDFAKIIKECFCTLDGWLFSGLDFASLEDRISALTTKDPNKLKVYTDGYDGHCLRAYAYFGEHMPDIDPNDVASINSFGIKKHPNYAKYGHFRQDSKAPTFALTYQGTFITLMNNCGFSEKLAKHIEKMYHELYVVSDQWVAAKLDEASKVGYVTVAFGLRVRTPLLKQVIRGTRATPFEAEAEGRTAGNALGQSWGLLNTRAASAFMKKVRASKYRLNIRPCAHIHDAQYYIIKDDLETILWVNKHLVEEVFWQDHPDIYHPQVKLGGEFSIFYPSWVHEMVVPNGCTEEQFFSVQAEHLAELEKKKQKQKLAA